MALLDLYDSEIDAAHEVLIILRQRSQGHRNRGEFDREIVERFFNIGLIVDVKWFHTNIEDVKMPEVEILRRVGAGEEFDHDRLRHEIVNDLLGLGEGGVIKMTPEDSAMIKATEQAHKRQHSSNIPHDHGDGNPTHAH